MQIVIDIPEDTYTYWINEPHERILADAIKNGKPLPKGHGRLIDADALMDYCQNDINKTVDCNDIARFPTIIEKENESKNI